MNPRNLRARHREHPEGIVIAKVGLNRKGELGEIDERAAIDGRHARFVESLPIVRNVVVCVLERPLKALQLQRGKLVAARGLDRLEVARRRFPCRHASISLVVAKQASDAAVGTNSVRANMLAAAKRLVMPPPRRSRVL
jgi:hypothetical protein